MYRPPPSLHLHQHSKSRERRRDISDSRAETLEPEREEVDQSGAFCYIPVGWLVSLSLSLDLYLREKKAGANA